MRAWTGEEWELAAQRKWAAAQEVQRIAASQRGARLSCTDGFARAIAAQLGEYELDVHTGTAVIDPAMPDVGRVMSLLLPWHDGAEVVLPVLPPSHRDWQVYRAESGGHHGYLSELHEPLATVSLPAEPPDWLPASEAVAGILAAMPHLAGSVS